MTRKKREQTVAQKLFKWPFRVQVPNGFLVTDAMLDQYGYPTSGDPEIDMYAANEMINVTKTIVQMAELSYQGADIRFVRPGDAKTVYEIITAHLTNWLHMAGSTASPGLVPLDDLRKLDSFAGLVKPVATGLNPINRGGSGVIDRLEDIARKRGRGSLIDTPATQQNKADPDHKSIADDIISTGNFRGFNW